MIISGLKGSEKCDSFIKKTLFLFNYTGCSDYQQIIA